MGDAKFFKHLPFFLTIFEYFIVFIAIFAVLIVKPLKILKYNEDTRHHGQTSGQVSS